MKIIICLFLITLNIFAAKEKIVATVNGRNITETQFDLYMQQRLLFVSNKKVTKQSVLNELINQELGISHAIDAKIDKDPVVKRKIEELMYHAQISKELENEFKKINVTDDEVKKYYEENKEYRTAHILFRLRANPSADDVKKALTQATEVYSTAMKTPDTFNELAAKFSQSSAGQVGGDLGFQPPTRYAPEYFEAIKGKSIGYITKPIRTQYGFHVIKILDVKKLEQINKNLYKKIIYDIKRDKIIDDYHAKLKSKAKVKIFENFNS